MVVRNLVTWVENMYILKNRVYIKGRPIPG